MTYPWEVPPGLHERSAAGIRCCPDGCQAIGGGHECASSQYETPPEPSLENLVATVRAIQADIAFAVTHTAVLARSDNALLRMVVNTPRGQEIPKGVVKYSDGGLHIAATIEFQDVGMPQVGVPTMSMLELAQLVHTKALELGLELR
jgi:hypothetical protein